MIKEAGILNWKNKQYEATGIIQIPEKGSELKMLGRIVSSSGVFMILLIAVMCLTMIGPKFAGYESYVVVSGSMEPAIPVGSIVYSKYEDPNLMRAGDVIVFSNASSGAAPVTHRIVTNNPLDGTITTKGDHNEHEDANPVIYDNVLGKVAAYVPHLGLVSLMFTTLLGKILAVILLAEGWLLIEIGRRLSHRE